MWDKSNSIRIRRKTFYCFIALLILFASVTPALAAYLGPDRTVTDTNTSCKVILLSCQYVTSKDLWKYKVVNSWLCSNESKPWTAYPSQPTSQGCYEATKGDKYWEKVQATNQVTITYDPATIVGSLENCTLNNGWCTTSPQLSMVGEEPLTEHSIIAIEGTLNGQNFACLNSSCSVSLPEGANTLSYWALSSWGDSSEMGTMDVKVDSQLPVLSGAFSGVSGSNGWYVSPVTFNGSASDTTSGLASFTCTLDGSPFGSCNSISINSEGPHELVLSASDNAGNNRVLNQGISIDTKNPALTSVLEGTLGSSGWYNIALLRASATDAAPGSGLSAFEYNIDNTSWLAFPSSGELDLPDGKHSVDLRATDTAGHSVSSAKSYWLDSLGPHLLLIPNGTLGENGWYVTSLDLSASVSDTTSGVDIFEYSLNNSSWAAYTQPLQLADGSHNISFWAQDKAGLVTKVDRSYQVDTQTPEIAGSISGTPGANGWYVSDVNISALAADPQPGSGIEAFTYILDGSGESPYTGPLILTEGPHSVQFKAKDRAGLTHSVQQTINVDTIRPLLNIHTALPNWIKGNVTLSGSATDAGSGISKVEISLNGGQSLQSVTGTDSWSYDWDTRNSSNGVHTVLVRVLDKAGLATEQTLSAKVDNSAPAIEMPASWLQWQTVTLDVWDDDSGLSEARVEITDPQGRWPKRVIPLNVNQFPLEFKWDRRFGDDTVAPHGTYTVQVIAQDAVNNSKQQTASLTILIDLPPGPTATPQPYSRATSIAIPTLTATAAASPTTTSTPEVSVFGNIEPTAQSTSAPTDPLEPRATPTQTSVLDWLESIFSGNENSEAQTTDLDVEASQSTDSASPLAAGILWGSTAAAIVGAVSGYALEERLREQEEKAAEKAAKIAQQAENQKNREKLQDQKMEKLEAKWAQEAAWEAAREAAQQQKEEFIADSREARMESKMDAIEADSDAKWVASQLVIQKREEQRKADELKEGLAAYYSGRKAGEEDAKPEENWWEKTKSFISENIIQPLDTYVYEPLIVPSLELIDAELVQPWTNNVYLPYIAPEIEKAKENITQTASQYWEDAKKKYEDDIAPVVEKVTTAVVTGFNWANTVVYQPYLQPLVEKTIDTVTDVAAWVNENIYQPYLQPVVAAIGQNIIQPYVVPFVDATRDTIVDGVNWLNENIYQPIIAPVAKDVSQWWDEYGEWVHGALDTVGFIPGIGEIADALNGLLYLAEGSYIEASVSLLAMIPVLGDLGKTVKWGAKIGTEVLEEAAEKVAKEVAEELAEKVVGETVEEALEQVVKESAEELAEKALKETGEELASKAVTETAENTAEAVIKNTADDVVEQVAKNTGETIASEATEQASKAITENVAQATVTQADDTAAEIISSLTTKYGDDAASLTQALSLVENYGDNALKVLDAVSPNAAEKLLKNLTQDSLENAINQGPEALGALVGWTEKELLDHGPELVARATKDADTLKAVAELLDLKPIDPNNLTDAQKALIEKIAGNSIFDGDAGQLVLGKWVDLDGGFIQSALKTSSTYYNPHPDVWNMLETLGTENQEQIAWLVNKQVIQTGIGKGIPIEYSLHGVPKINAEMNAIEAIFSGETQEVIKKELGSNNLPFRMRELLELKNAGFEITFDDINNSYIMIKP